MKHKVIYILGSIILGAILSAISHSVLNIWLKIAIAIVIVVVYFKLDSIYDKKKEQRYNNKYTFLSELEIGDLVCIKLNNGHEIGPAVFLMDHFQLSSISVVLAPYYNDPERVHELGKNKEIKLRKIESIEVVESGNSFWKVN
ncbi:hypothetical protein ACQKMD_10575 [Viridibacillus sp. NPDC096237]|uniref:hypothetical protein n=1 Tax=Viridibacillus sp. NPDC096237 TaxID=3390721 RepID=UPI003D05A004